jgi:hypothetical protein
MRIVNKKPYITVRFRSQYAQYCTVGAILAQYAHREQKTIHHCSFSHYIAQSAQYCSDGAILRSMRNIVPQVQYCAVGTILRILRKNIIRVWDLSPVYV